MATRATIKGPVSLDAQKISLVRIRSVDCECEGGSYGARGYRRALSRPAPSRQKPASVPASTRRPRQPSARWERLPRGRPRCAFLQRTGSQRKLSAVLTWRLPKLASHAGVAAKSLKLWSGRWDSNPRPQPWQGVVLNAGRPASALAAESRCQVPSIGEKLEIASKPNGEVASKPLKSMALPRDSNPCFRRERAVFAPSMDRHGQALSHFEALALRIRSFAIKTMTALDAPTPAENWVPVRYPSGETSSARTAAHFDAQTLVARIGSS
jgi:hypothetical protein